MEAGPDNTPLTSGYNIPINNRICYVAPYIGNPTLKDTVAAQEMQNHKGDGAGNYWQNGPTGPTRTYPGAAGYGQRDGVVALDFSTNNSGTLTVGLCYLSQIDRVGVVNWGFAIEGYYV